MPQFRVKNLMVNVLPEEGAQAPGAGPGLCPGITFCLGHSPFCPVFTPHCNFFSPCPNASLTACGICSFKITLCPWDTRICHNVTVVCPQESFVCPGGSIFCRGVSDCGGSVIDPDDLVINPEELVALKAQLRQALERVEAQEAALAERMAPQTEDELASLEQALKDGLAELSNRRAELKKRNG